MNSREVFACYSIAAAAVVAHRWQRTRRQRVRGYIVIHELVHGFYTVCVQTGQWRAVWGGVGTEDKRRMTTNDIYIYFFPLDKIEKPSFSPRWPSPAFLPEASINCVVYVGRPDRAKVNSRCLYGIVPRPKAVLYAVNLPKFNRPPLNERRTFIKRKGPVWQTSVSPCHRSRTS